MGNGTARNDCGLYIYMARENYRYTQHRNNLLLRTADAKMIVSKLPGDHNMAVHSIQQPVPLAKAKNCFQLHVLAG